jgi:hypothetical protein
MSRVCLRLRQALQIIGCLKISVIHPRGQHRLRDFGLRAFPPSSMTLPRLVPQTRSSHKRLKVDLTTGSSGNG